MISVVIPTYKKEDQLIRNLNRNLPFCKSCEVIVVNDFPENSIAKHMTQFPEVQLLENERNLGFSGAVNAGISKAQGDFVVLLNSDVVLKDNSFQRALIHFEKNSNLFAVAFAQKEKDGHIVGKNRIYWQKGFFRHDHASDREFGKTAWAEGGSSIFHREKLIKLDMFDTLYAPFYWEDIDLSYRAWKQGYEVLFDPSIVVEHHHESTIGTYFSKQSIDTIAFRNQLYFIWKNITDLRLRADHTIQLPITLVSSALNNNSAISRGFLQAVHRMFLPPSLIEKRSDREILKMFTGK
jgi:GT2 family glycosyltransferase